MLPEVSKSLEILHFDKDVVVISKPAGLLVHRTLLDRGERECVVQNLRDQLGRWVYPVHRLDRPTSGALILTFSSEMARMVAQQFIDHTVNKEYLAVVRGFPHVVEQWIDHPLREEKDAIADMQARRDQSDQSALTYVACLDRVELPVQVDRYPTSRYALMRARPKTGRKHQIRRHLRHLGHPIVGDVTYGSGRHNRHFKQNFNCHRLLLACTRLDFQHPRSGEPIAIRAPLETCFAEVLQQLGWGAHVNV